MVVTNDGTNTSAMAARISMVAANRPSAMVGRPRPITPFTVPPSRKTAAIQSSVRTTKGTADSGARNSRSGGYGRAERRDASVPADAELTLRQDRMTQDRKRGGGGKSVY